MLGIGWFNLDENMRIKSTIILIVDFLHGNLCKKKKCVSIASNLVTSIHINSKCQQCWTLRICGLNKRNEIIRFSHHSEERLWPTSDTSNTITFFYCILHIFDANDEARKVHDARLAAMRLVVQCFASSMRHELMNSIISKYISFGMLCRLINSDAFSILHQCLSHCCRWEEWIESESRSQIHFQNFWKPLEECT